MYNVTPRFKKVQQLTDDINNITRDNIIGVRVIRAFNAEKFHSSKFEKTNTDLTETAKLIKCPTFIIWGDVDAAVPVEDAYKLEKLIPDSGLTIYENCTHYAYLERLGQTNAIIKSFIK